MTARRRTGGAGVVKVRAYAKINLSLRIAARRSDGYHELQTVYQSVALHDTLRFARTTDPFHLTCDDPECPADSTNLVWRAARALWRASGRRGAPGGVSVHLQKRIPMQAGLGGGSSDAAAALRVLAPWWGVPADRLAAIAAALGADVPYFLRGGAVLGIERGDVLFPLAEPPRSWVVLAVPPLRVRTADAYGWWDRRPVSAAHANRPGSNDLQASVASRHPEIARLARALGRAGAAPAAMSGSGSAVFGLFARENRARAAAHALEAPGRRIILTRTIGPLRSTAFGRSPGRVR